MFTRAILWVGLVTLSSIGIVRGDDFPKLTGSTMKTEEAVAKADAIFLGQAEELEPGSEAEVGLEPYYAKVKVLQILRRAAVPLVFISLPVHPYHHESAPKVRDSYIFFVNSEPNRILALKVIPDTEDNIAMVKRLITQLPAK